MLSNKNNKINPFKSMILSPVLNYKQSWYFSIKPLYSLVMLHMAVPKITILFGAGCAASAYEGALP